MRTQLRGSAILLLASFIWGMAFAAQSTVSMYMQPFAFTAVRSVITCVSLLIFMLATGRMGKMKRNGKPFVKHLPLGAAMGVLLFAATGLQQAGIGYTTAAKSGFITALYIVMVPLIGILLKKRPTKWIWVGVACSLAGMYLLCMKEGISVNIGDVLTLGCALMFSLHILLVDKYAEDYDPAALCCIQFGTAGVLGAIVMVVFEGSGLSGMQNCVWSVLYVGVLSGAVAYTLQIAGQKGTDPTVASLVMCMESVFAALGGWLLLGQSMSARELIGCALMLSGSILALLPDKKQSVAI